MSTTVDLSRSIAYEKETADLFLDDSKVRVIEDAINNIVESYGSDVIEMQREEDNSAMEEENAEFPSFLFDESVNEVGPRISDKDIVRWTGYVTSIGKQTFTVNLFDLDKDDNFYEVGELPMEHVSKDDKSLLTIGAVFYLSAGYFQRPTGQVKKGVLLKFQRAVEWSGEEYDSAVDRANNMRHIVRFEETE